MKTRSLMAAGVAAAGAGAVALTALTPATQPELAAAPVASHQIVLTAGDFDLAGNLETLWNGASGRAEDTGTVLKAFTAASGLGLDAIGDMITDAPLTTLGTLPITLTALVQGADIIGGGGLVPLGAGNYLDASVVRQTLGLPAAAPWTTAVEKVATNVDDAGAKIAAAQIRGNQQLTNVLKAESLVATSGALQRTSGLTEALEAGDVKKALTKAFKDNPKDLRRQLVGDDASGALGGSLGAIRNQVDTNRGALRAAVDSQLNKSDAGKAVQKNVVKPVREAVDKVRDTVRETGEKVRKEVRKALD